MGSPNIVQGFNYHIHRNATDIVVNQEKNIIQYPYWGENITILK